MTIASTTSKVSYNGSGSTGPFPITFRFTKNAGIIATKRSSAGIETVLTLTTHYTLTGAGESSGGALTLVTALAVGESLVIARVPSIVQEVDYVENSAFPAETHEGAIDLLTMICQSLKEQIDRSVKVPISSTTDPSTLIAQLQTDAASATTSASTAATKANEASASAAAAAAAAASVPSAGTVLLKASNLSDLADVAAARTSLGLKSAALLESTVLAQLAVVGAYTRQQYAVPVVLTAQNGAIALDADLHQDIDISATGAITLGAPANAVRGKTIFMTLYAASALAITWNAAFKPNADNALDATFAAGKRVFLNFRCVDGANWLLMGRTKEA